ncbi:SGNH/GDSL hydrolase family protein [Paenibacillus sinopodophylli]|uniref:SGNH/GDSL hydrolase family protein n=1 Tax=Paenibacillus sinopodophylli TaxID=1837342 RepID=UPI00110CFB78|nr:SGNH/GDSL hydrolase family protein [Paenibacillus sinopodophylli]
MKSLYSKDAVIPDVKRIVFFGDSITDEGTYIAFMDAYFLQHWPEHAITLINLGVSSETASGLSEPDHPFPRPCVHDRLDRALAESKPDWVVLCYGMNDGIYYPFSEERFAAYKQGIESVIQKIKKAGAKTILMTPPPFDPESYAAPTQPAGKGSYSFNAPFEHYEDVLKQYAKWILSLENKVDAVVSIHEPLLELWSQRREHDAGYRTGDGIHPSAEGHWVIAKELLKTLFHVTLEQAPQYVLQPEGSSLFDSVLEKHLLLSSAWKEHVGHTNPNKAVALPLAEALERAEQITAEIRYKAKALQLNNDIL